MPLSATATQTTDLNGQTTLQNSQVFSPSEQIIVDFEIPAGSAALPINIGIANTAKIKSFQISNTGAADITALTLDAGVVDLAIKKGESIMAAGPGVAKKLADAWAGAATFLQLKATTPAGPDKARLQAVFVVDAA